MSNWVGGKALASKYDMFSLLQICVIGLLSCFLFVKPNENYDFEGDDWHVILMKQEPENLK